MYRTQRRAEEIEITDDSDSEREDKPSKQAAPRKKTKTGQQLSDKAKVSKTFEVVARCRLTRLGKTPG